MRSAARSCALARTSASRRRSSAATESRDALANSAEPVSVSLRVIRSITDHDALVGRALALVLAGGSLPHPTLVSEQYLLDLEREAFLGLCGERKTLERIQHTLKTGKPLRN